MKFKPLDSPLNTQAAIPSTWKLLIPLWKHLSFRRQKQLILLFLLMIITGFAELFSLAAVIPFLALLSDPSSLANFPIIILIGSYFGFTEPSQFVLPSAFLFSISAVSVALIRSITLRINGLLAASIGSDLSLESYRRTLYQPYEVHLKFNSSSVINTSISQISRCVSGLSSFLQLSTSIFISLFLVIGFCFIDWRIALLAGCLFGSIYALIAIFTRRYLRTNSMMINVAGKLQLKSLQEGLGSIRDILLDGTYSTFLYQYNTADRQLRKLQATNQFLFVFPRYAVESFGLVIVSILGGFGATSQGSDSSIIPILGTFALGSQKLLPALQQIYSGWSVLRGFNTDFYGVLQMLRLDIPLVVNAQKPLPFNKSICLENISFRYSDSPPNILYNLNLEIFSGERIGVVGATGSGKSTMMDILMGLLSPTAGSISVDGRDLHDDSVPIRLLEWRATIAHVPQNIYLSDSSIAENIAFGVPFNQIDMERVKDCAERSRIANFIDSAPGSYSNIVGERGVRLSGGQRQRIGIARALYKSAKVLVLDEATSALDISTEEAVMESVEGLSKDLTIIIIAHRLSTLERCDRVIRLDNGQICTEPPTT